jgi:hypothetical protein
VVAGLVKVHLSAEVQSFPPRSAQDRWSNHPVQQLFIIRGAHPQLPSPSFEWVEVGFTLHGKVDAKIRFGRELGPIRAK